MPSKKELQEQIDKLERIILLNKSDINIELGKIFGYFNDLFKLRKQFLALLDYLKLEYKVEDKHLEGFKKK